MDDDIWDDSNEDFEKERMEREWNHLRKQHMTGGYRESLDKAKEDELQSGFNQGFKQGAIRGLAFGKLLGVLNGADMLLDLPSNPLSYCTEELRETVSTTVGTLNDLFKKRAEFLAKPPETLEIKKETTYDSSILSIFSEFVHNQLSCAKTYSDKQKSFVFDVVTALLLSSTEEDGLLAMCFWDLFPLVVSYLLPSEKSGKKVEERAQQILNKMATDCNAKEMFLLIMESFENIKENSVKVYLINLLVLVVPRLQVEKLKTFMKTSFPHLLHTVHFAPTSGSSQETKEFARDMTVEFHGQDPENYKTEVDTSKVSLFMPHLIEYIKYFVQVLSNHPFHNQVDELNIVSQQQHMVLAFLLRLLESLVYCPLLENSIFKEMAEIIMSYILKLGVSVQFLFENKAEAWERRQRREEEEEENVVEEQDKEYFLSGLGLSCYFYMTFVKSVHLAEFPSVISSTFKLKQSVPFITLLLLTPPAAEKGLDLLEYFTTSIPKSSIQVENIVETFFFSLSQSVIHFMVNCPIEKVRTRAYNLLNNYISLFDDHTRFYILKNIVINCQYTSVTGLMTTRIKQEAELAWPKGNEQPTSLFVSEKIREIFPFLVTTKNLLDRVDVVMGLLNLYRFLIIRDKQTNYTGVWKDSELKYMKERFIDKLVKKTEAYIEKLQKTPDKKEKKQQEAMINMYNLPKMSDEDTQAYNQMTTLTLTLMQDTAKRVSEVISGKPLFTGVPTIK